MLLPAWEMSLYGLLTVGSHLYAFYEAHRVSRSKSVVGGLAPALAGVVLPAVVYFAPLHGGPVLLLPACQPASPVRGSSSQVPAGQRALS